MRKIWKLTVNLVTFFITLFLGIGISSELGLISTDADASVVVQDKRPACQPELGVMFNTCSSLDASQVEDRR